MGFSYIDFCPFTSFNLIVPDVFAEAGNTTLNIYGTLRPERVCMNPAGK
jgi:hypothetical protein